VLLEDALASMASADVGRLPVLRTERLVGIITRHDILLALYAPES
jgi:CBS domain-containing protein